MNAYDVMHEWDNATGRGPRSEEELDTVIPGLLGDVDYAEWKTALEASNMQAIIKGMKIWGLPMEPLKPFDLDSGIETHERAY